MNSVILIGRLTRDPELRYTPSSQTAVAHFTLAVDRPVQSGQERQADFIRITVFGKQAETVNRYLKKGSQCAVNGRIQTGSYRNKDGQTVYTTDVIANRVEFLGSSNNSGGSNNSSYFGGGNPSGGSYNSQSAVPQQDDFAPMPSMEPDYPDSFQAADDDIPF